MTTPHPPGTHEGSPTILLRPAEERDADPIARLLTSPQDLRQVSPEEDFPLDASTVRHWIRERASGYVLLERGKVVAYAELIADSGVPERLWIGHMMVDPHRRGLGLGQRLVRALLNIASEERCAREVAISAFIDNPRALQCYRTCGFLDQGEVRVGDRTLVELRYPIPAQQPVVSLVTAAGAVLVGVSTGVLVFLPQWTAWDWVAMVPILSSIALATWGAHALVPRRRTPRAARPLRISAYALVIGSSSVAVAAVVNFARGLNLGLVSLAIAAGTVVAWGLLLLAARKEHDFRPKQS